MIPATPHSRQLPPAGADSWQQQLASAITHPEHLLAELGLDPALAAPAATSAFPMRVPWSYVRRMRRGDPGDPLLLQVLPVARELQSHPAFGPDPLHEQQALQARGLLRKYRGRVLLITTSACAVQCRYCFRREFPYAQQTGDVPRWTEALAAIGQDPSIEEVILSGGDPLSLSDARLGSLTTALARIPHVRRLRIHTRQPIVLPARVDAGLTEWLSRLPWPTAIVLHANHANEIDDEVRDACQRLRGTGVTLLNQSVLLRDINDDAATLAALSRALFDAGVLPYYLHLLDRVQGAAHFEVDAERAQRILGELTASLSGFLVPRLVREVAGAPAKLPLMPIF